MTPLPLLPALARWLPGDTPTLQKCVIARAMVDIGLLEEPPGSNRSPTIDSYLNAVGSPLGSSWCAAALSAWVRDAGGKLPPDAAGSCNSWFAMAQAHGTLSKVPGLGSVVLYAYGAPGVADHCGVIVRTDPLLLSVEGNTTMKRQLGSQREGVGCTIGEVDHDHVLTYITLEAA